jgi:phospholipid/cholesterol/gamma-HCH transport system substrate-binding protein
VKHKEFKVGLFMAMALVLLYLGFNFLKGIDFFSSSTKYYAIYDNVDQLAPSNPVLVNGYAVGRVSHIRIMQERQNKVLVELDIDSDIQLGDSTKAILNSDFLGGKSILLNIGKVTTPRSPKDTIIAEVAKGMFDVFAETAEPVADNLQTTIRKLNTILDNFSKNSEDLNEIFAKLKTTPDLLNQTLANSNSKIDELSTSFKSTAEHLNQTLNELRPTLKNFQVLSDSLKRMELNQTIEKTQQTLTQLNQTLAKLSSGDNTASKLLTDDSLYVNLNKMLSSIDSLANHFNDNPKHFMAPLGKSKKKIDRDRRKEEEERKKTQGNN